MFSAYPLWRVTLDSEEEAVPVSERLGLLWGWGWLVDLPSWWVFLLMLLLSLVVVKFVLRPLETGRILRRSDEFMGFQLQMFLAPAIALGAELVRAGNPVGVGNSAWGWVLLLLAIIVTGALTISRMRRLPFHRARQLRSVTYWYQLGITVFAIYAVLHVCALGFIGAPLSFGMVVLRLVMLACIAVWLMGVRWDYKHHLDLVNDETLAHDEHHNRYLYVHVENSWPWQHKWQNFGFWWRRYIDDWKVTPARISVQWTNFRSYTHL